ncbi:MAG: stage II sporulation protein M [Clostridiales bacterium]|nr:stage II sporulation protein M [Clostridiales bacterium]
MLKRWKIDILQHIQKNITLYLVTLFAILTGLASGIFTASSMPGDQKTALGTYLQSFFQQSSFEPIKKSSVFLQSLLQNFQSTFLIWLSGMFLFGIPFIFLLVGARSFFIGFAIGFLINQYQFGGFLFALLCILPQTIIYLTSFLGIGVLALENSIDKLKNRKVTQPKEQMKRNTGIYTWKTLSIFFLLILGCLFEAYISPIFFSLFRWVFK